MNSTNNGKNLFCVYLYTMSSGQLSGILLAFSLALHKIFVNDGLNIMLIDDPVQCMDDLNIVSFVELMRTEFPDIQLLISTHENSFAGYIGYKYKKYSLPVQRCNLKEISRLWYEQINHISRKKKIMMSNILDVI